MFKKLVYFSISTIFLFFGFGCGEKYTGPPADLVIKNANIVTIDKNKKRARAVAVIGEEIIAVTSNGAIDQYIEEGKTEVIDAKGRLLIPGLNDAHAHFGPVNPDYTIVGGKVVYQREEE